MIILFFINIDYPHETKLLYFYQIWFSSSLHFYFLINFRNGHFNDCICLIVCFSTKQSGGIVSVSQSRIASLIMLICPYFITLFSEPSATITCYHTYSCISLYSWIPAQAFCRTFIMLEKCFQFGDSSIHCKHGTITQLCSGE